MCQRFFVKQQKNATEKQVGPRAFLFECFNRLSWQTSFNALFETPRSLDSLSGSRRSLTSRGLSCVTLMKTLLTTGIDGEQVRAFRLFAAVVFSD